MSNLHALIMAGGGGTRLWPESRTAFPKQFIKLVDERSLIRIAFDRITPLVPPDRVLVVTGQRYAALIRDQLPELPAHNVLVEPAGRNTAPAIGLGAIHLQRQDPAAVMAVLTADHIMREEEVFRATLAAAGEAAESGRIVTLGITPSSPETGYGYIERGDPLGVFQEQTLYQVRRFREKPDRATAERFLRSGRFYWNSGMFIWQVSTVLKEIERQQPDLYAALAEIAAALGTPQELEVLDRAWSSIRPISIDYGVMERAKSVTVLPVDPGWSDVGSWSAVYDECLAQTLPDTGDGNVVQGGELLALDTQGCLIRSNKLVAAVGLRDLIIVETDDALFVCPRTEAQRVKELVNRLQDQKRERYL